MPAADEILSAEYRYDVFISYSHVDSAWVRGELVPALDANQLRVIIDTEFDIGKPIDQNIAEAITKSRFTLVVLTRDWIESSWSSFELGLAGTQDPAARKGKILPILLSECDIPPRLSLLTYGDFTTPENRPREMTRLLKALGCREGATGPGAVNAGPARRALIALRDLLRDPEIHAAAMEFRGAFVGMCSRIDPVVRYKRMHDLLHQLEFDCYDRIRHNTTRFGDPEDDFAYQEMVSCLSALESVVEELEDTVSAPSFSGMNTSWISDLRKACDNFREAVDSHDAELLTGVIDAMTRILLRRPSQINNYLVEAARALRLGDLVTAMERLHTTLLKLDAASIRAAEFHRGIVALGQLAAKLDGLIRIHTIWQEIDCELHPIEAVLADSIAKGDFTWWRNLKSLTANLSEEPSEAPPELDVWKVRLDGAMAESAQKKIKDSFWRFQRLAKTTFRSTDDALKRQCDALPDLFTPLATVEEVLR